MLLGQYANRSPLSYFEYRCLFEKQINYVKHGERVDLIVLAYAKDFETCSEEIAFVKHRNSSVKVVVLSEEPFWDFLRGGDLGQLRQTTMVNDSQIDFFALNHVTTSIFNFEHLPYFITTNNEYFVRYAYLFKRNSSLSKTAIKEALSKAEVKAGFFAEKRSKEKFDHTYSQDEVYGLSRYRTKLAEVFEDEGNLKVGAGWEKGKRRRQELPDWHLDKLLMLDNSCLFVSAIENTHQNYYITEKLFDAFAVLGIPLYWAGLNHRITDLCDSQAYLNLFDFSVDEAKLLINGFEVTNDFLDAYSSTQKRMSKLFSSPLVLYEERMRLVRSITDEFEKVLNS